MAEAPRTELETNLSDNMLSMVLISFEAKDWSLLYVIRGEYVSGGKWQSEMVMRCTKIGDEMNRRVSIVSHEGRKICEREISRAKQCARGSEKRRALVQTNGISSDSYLRPACILRIHCTCRIASLQVERVDRTASMKRLEINPLLSGER